LKLHEINEEIAKACDMRTKSVLAVQRETFRRLREIIERGDRVSIPEFGTFLTKEKAAADGGEATKTIRFRLQTASTEADETSDEDRKARRQAKKAKKAEAAEGDAEGGDAATATAAEQP